MNAHHEEEEQEGTLLGRGGAGAFTVIWVLTCISFLLWLFIH